MVLLVLDTQKFITTDKLYNFDVFVSNVKKLIEEARKNNMEVVYCRHYDDQGMLKGSDNFQIYDGFKPEENEKIFDKSVNSCFKESGLLEYLQSKGEDEVILVGLMTDYCVDASIKCGFEHGLKMIIPANTNSTFDNDIMSAETSYKYYNEFMWPNRYAECIPFEDAIELIKNNAK